MKHRRRRLFPAQHLVRIIALPVLLCLAAPLLPGIAFAHGNLPPLPEPGEPYAVTRARLEAQGLWHPSRSQGRTPPPNPQVGDTWDWYVWDLSGMPVATLKPCTVRGMGDHCYVVVDDDEWTVGMDQADVDRIVDRFDNHSAGNWPDQGIWDLNTFHFGDPPNPLDGLDRIFLFYYRFNIPADGYFWVFDQYPDGSTPPWSSNECDVIYMAVDGGQPAGDYMLAVTAHEFQHMIHFARDENEDSWVDEGLSELAMWLYGHPDAISSFNTQPDNSLVAWNGTWSDYIKVYLWTLYLYEQYGGQPMIWALIHNPLNGMAGYLDTLTDMHYTVAMEDVFRDWSVANFLDDTGVPDGQYGYAGDALPPFSPWRTHGSYPAGSSSSVQNWAGEYVRLVDMAGAPSVTFNGADARDFRVSLMALDPVRPTLVRFMELDESNDGSLVFAEALGYEEVILTVANVYPSAAATYSYAVDMIPTDAPAGAALLPRLAAYPNPFNPRTRLDFSLAAPGAVRLSVHDARGREVALLRSASFAAGTHQVAWQPAGLASGIYLARLEVDGRLHDTTKLVLVK
ncbi:MAG: T9SS type A sorting domain-containing protein [Candidatus Krumholzibacteriota bacterium]|nr:T9SS type A sorting domain-containing protein [Candidatus Krumholzibacteriota bacterium]